MTLRRFLLIRLLVVVLLSTLLAPVAANADTNEQNEIERQCLILLLTDYAKYGAVPLILHFDAYLVCGSTWWISWLSERAQSIWWRGQYAYALDVLAAARR